MKTTLFKNASFYTFHKNQIAHWLVVRNGKIKALGTKDQPLPQDVDEVIDLQGATVFPAFGDAHVHSLWMAHSFFEADLSPARSLNEALEILKAFALEFNLEPGQWLLGRGFNKNRWQDGRPNKTQLNQLFPENPVYIESLDCHSAWVNSLALKVGGINGETPDPAGGRIERDAAGEPTGLLYDRAMEKVKQKIPVPDDEQLLKGMRRLVQKLWQNGITTIHSMEGCRAFELWNDYFNRFGHQLRVCLYFPLEDQERLFKSAQEVRHSKNPAVCGIKLFADGSLGSQTAEMLEPYEASENRGLSLLDEQSLIKLIHRAEQNGFAAAVHAIGDAAVLKVLRVFKQSETIRKKTGVISRVEHAQLVPPQALALFRQAGLMASIQPIHIADDVLVAEKHWGNRSRFAYPFKALREHGVELAFGSDAPVAEPDVLRGVFSAVYRRPHFNLQAPPWHKDQAISLREAFWAFTVGVARAGGHLSESGTLQPGKQADFVVLSANPFSVNAAQLLELKVVQTVARGEVVFNNWT